jgi:hypothetical protein
MVSGFDIFHAVIDRAALDARQMNALLDQIFPPYLDPKQRLVHVVKIGIPARLQGFRNAVTHAGPVYFDHAVSAAPYDRFNDDKSIGFQHRIKIFPI